MAAISHRGGDGNATFLDPTNGLAIGHLFRNTFSRPGDEPHPALAEDGPLVATIEGSISNLGEFPNATYTPPGNRDAQALLRFYQTNKTDFTGGLWGYFALALWDGLDKSLTLAEDPMGRSPLYYYQAPTGGLLVFASELKGVLAHPAVPRHLDHEALSIFLTLGYVQAPYSMLRGVRKLISGQSLTFDGSREPLDSRFSPFQPQEKGPDSIDYWLPQVREEIGKSVARITASTPRLAIFLSGGIDSSILAAALKEQGVSEFKAFTIATTSGPSIYDLPWAEMAAAAVGCEEEVLTLDESDISADLVAGLLRQMDDPIDSTMRGVTQHFLLQAAKRSGYDSLLVGSGAELHFSNLRHWRSFKDRNSPDLDWRETLTSLIAKPRFFSFADQNQLLTHRVSQDPLLRHTAEADLQRLTGFELLDAFSLNDLMRNWVSRYALFNVLIPPLSGQQIRSPFYEEGLTQLGLRVPPNLKGSARAANAKILLKRAYDPLLNLPLDQREKRALPGAPRQAWLNQALLAGLQRLGESGIFKRTFTDQMTKRYQRGRDQQAAMLLFILHCWLEQYLFQREPFAEFLS